MLNIREISSGIRIGLLDLKAFSAAGGITVKREIEKAGTQHVLKHLLDQEPFELGYSATNKPFLKGRSGHISISHSHDKLAIIYNASENTGIDIELVRDKVKTVRHKFLNDGELAFANDDTGTMITLWAAKETLYKLYGSKEVDFKANLFVDAFSGNTITGHIRMPGMQKDYLLAHEHIDNYKLVYVLHEL